MMKRAEKVGAGHGKKLYLCRSIQNPDTTDNRDRYSDFDALVQRHRRMIRAICLWNATGGVSHFRRRKQVETIPLDEEMPLAAAESDDRRATIDELATGLTDHERQVLQLTLDGWSTDEIADELDVKNRTVVQIRWRIVQKMKEKAQTI